jgi:site-specific DNA-methyltransferase (adenine-specific)
MQLVKVNLKKLKQAKYNPRKKLKPSDKEYQQLKKSIENLGYSEPIIKEVGTDE